MLLFFRQTIQQKSKEQEAAQNRLAIRIVRQCLKIQASWATFLQYKTEGLSCRIKKYGLAFFCLLSGGYNTYLVIHSFTKHPQKAILFTPIKFSTPVSQTENKNLPPAVVISPEEFQKLQRHLHWQDSLAQRLSGEKAEDTFSGPFPD